MRAPGQIPELIQGERDGTLDEAANLKSPLGEPRVEQALVLVSRRQGCPRRRKVCRDLRAPKLARQRAFGHEQALDAHRELLAAAQQRAGRIRLDDPVAADKHDATRIFELLGRHLKYTGSSKAKLIIDNWAEYLPKFVKVMPVEYARALADLEKAQETSNGMTVGVKRTA